MKKLFATVCGSLLVLGIAAHAGVPASFAFPVKLRASVTFPQSATAVAKLGVTESSLVTAGNHVLLVIDFTNHGATLVEVDETNTVVTVLMSSQRFAILPDGTFSAAMVIQALLPTQPQATPADGIINLSGKITPATGAPKSVNVTVAGVLNDSTTFDGAPDIIIKGKLSKDGTPFPFVVPLN